MKPGRFHILLEEGVPYHRKFRWRSNDVIVPLALYGAVAQIRHPTQEDVDLLEVANGDGIVLRDTEPNLELTISEVRISALDITKTTWRLLMTPPSPELPFLLLEGDVLKEW